MAAAGCAGNIEWLHTVPFRIPIAGLSETCCNSLKFASLRTQGALKINELFSKASAAWWIIMISELAVYF